MNINKKYLNFTMIATGFLIGSFIFFDKKNRNVYYILEGLTLSLISSNFIYSYSINTNKTYKLEEETKCYQ